MKNKIKLLLFFCILGGIVGTIGWVFLAMMKLGINLLWEIIPSKISKDYTWIYTIVVCLLGGLLIGVCHKYFGDYPENTNKVLSKISDKKTLLYKNMPAILICSLLPLIFGGSLGPEAALVGIIASLCSWVNYRIKFLNKEVKDLPQMGFAAAFGIVFRAPLYGLMYNMENNKSSSEIKLSNTSTYLVTILTGFGAFILLNKIYPTLGEMAHFTDLSVKMNEVIWLVPLAIVGLLGGMIFNGFEKLTQKITEPLKNKYILSGIIGGLTLSILSLILPYIMFSGEHAMSVVMHDWKKYSVCILLLTAIVKMFITNFCIQTGWKGGDIFPVIFSGILLGYVGASILPINPTFAVMVTTTSLTTVILKKPVAVVLLLMLCFPVKGIIPMLVAALIASSLASLKTNKAN